MNVVSITPKNVVVSKINGEVEIKEYPLISTGEVYKIVNKIIDSLTVTHIHVVPNEILLIPHEKNSIVRFSYTESDGSNITRIDTNDYIIKNEFLVDFLTELILLSRGISSWSRLTTFINETIDYEIPITTNTSVLILQLLGSIFDINGKIIKLTYTNNPNIFVLIPVDTSKDLRKTIKEINDEFGTNYDIKVFDDILDTFGGWEV